MDLDAMLDEAAPPLADRSPELTGLLDELVAATRPVVSRRRRRRAALVGGAVGIAGVLGLGGAAAAGIGPDLVQGLFPWTSDGGTSCELVASFEPRAPGDPNYSSSQAAAMASAEEWVASFDLGSVDQNAAEERWFRYLEDVSVGDPTRAELEETFQGQDLETHALILEATRRLERHLADRGFDLRSLDGGVGVQCGAR